MNTLQDNWSKLEEVVKLLLKKETITGDEVRRIIKGETSEQILKASENIEEDNNSNIDEEKKAKEENAEIISEKKLIEKVEELEEKIKTQNLAEGTIESAEKTDEVSVDEKHNSSESELEKVTETKDKKDNDDNPNDSSENNDNDSDSGNEDINEKSENSEKKKSNFKLPSFME